MGPTLLASNALFGATLLSALPSAARLRAGSHLRH